MGSSSLRRNAPRLMPLLALVLPLLLFQAASASQRFVLQRSSAAATSSSGETVLGVEIASSSTAGSSVVSATEGMDAISFDTYVTGAEWVLQNWSSPLETLGAALQSTSDQTVELDVQFPDSVGADVTILMFELDTTWTFDLALVFGSDALAGLPALSQVILEHNTIAGPIELSEDEYTLLQNISVVSTGNTVENSLSNSSSSSCVKEETIGELEICIVSSLQNYGTSADTGSASSTQSKGTVEPESSSSADSSSAMSSAMIVLVCTCVVVLVVGAAFFRRFKRKASKFVEDRLTFTNQEDGLLSVTGRGSEAETEPALVGDAKLLAEMDLGKDQVTVQKKLGVQGLWLGEYHNDKVVVLKLVPRTLHLSLKEVDAIRLSYVPLQHTNVVHFLGSSFTEREEVLVVVEHMARGSLRSVLADERTELAWPQRLQMSQEICSGLAFLRSIRGVEVSRNLTAKSVLVDGDLTCKLDIFDYASSLRTDLAPIRSYGQGDIVARAPELLTGGELTPAAEVYALGVILCEISSRSTLFEHLAAERGPTLADIFIATEVVAQRLKPTPAEDAPAAFRELALRCLAYEPSNRPTASEVVELLSK
ncbi:hypothetical protein BBJ28_00004630 [Nothophytophthora sp. Chile5]|nr:hypothetical protein BBJ28_00004630 [Nothophytophthora sp. Chile5]